MRQMLARLLTIAHPDDEYQQRGRAVVVLSLGMIAMALLFVVVVLCFQPNPETSLKLVVLAITIFGTAIILARRGLVDLAAWGMLGFTLVGPFVAMLSTPVVGTAPLTLVFAILIASMVVRSWQIWLVLAAALLGLLLTVMLLAAWSYTPNEIETTVLVAALIMLPMVALISYLSASETQRERAALRREIAERLHVEHALLQAKDAAESANRAKSAFLAHMSHELRMPLTAILGYTNLLAWQAEQQGAESFLSDLGVIESSGKHLLNLINNVLDLSKIEAGKLDLLLETFDVATMLNQLVASVQPLVGKNRNHLVIDCSPDIGIMYADQTKVRQILINMLSNASKYTEQGVITIAAQPECTDEHDWVVFHVSDTGIGIPPEAISQLFQTFKRVVDPPNAPKYDGAGLGLALSQHICRIMGGNITVQSTLNVGTTFSIRLPRRVAQPVAELV